MHTSRDGDGSAGRPRRSSDRRLGRWSSYAWLALTVCLVAAVVYGVAPSAGLAMAAFGIAGATCTAATVIGILRHRPAASRAWWAITASITAFVLGAALRLPEDQSRLAHLIPDVFSVCGYLLSIVGVLGWLHHRRGRADWSSIADASIVGIGAALVAWTQFIVPALELPGIPAAHRALFATYPVFDVILLVLLVQMVFTQARRNAAFNLFLLAMVAFFLGDLAYVALDSGVSTLGRPVIDLPYFVAFGMLAAAALHPSMRSLAAPGLRRRSTRWDAVRTTSVTVSLLAVGVLPILVPAEPGVDVAIRLALTVTVVVAVVFRALRAINRFADGEAAARYRASHDPLTGLPNRAGLTEHLAQLGQHGAAPLSVLFLDLDGFKLANDSFGHEVGDQLLREVARRLRAVVGPQDLIARLGGDEFVVVVRSGAGDAAVVAQRVVESFSRPFTMGVGEVFLATGVGITTVDGATGPLDGDALVRDADIAMYVAKTRGRNQIAVFDSSLRDQVDHRLSTETALRFAVERGELELLYQPLVRLADHQVIGYEALLRWNHPVRGQVSPVEFIPVAEDTGLIVQIGDWAIRESVRQAAIWRAQGRDAHVSVNVSARQLRDRSLVTTVANALARWQLPPDALWIELTETGLVEDPDAALEALEALRALGVTVAIDDFGTGYSSLSYLKRFPVSVVKIDREFVRDLGSAAEDDAIVRAVVAMGSALRLTLVAEGVERTDQALALSSLGCDVAQGWLYGTPATADSVLWGDARGRLLLPCGAAEAS